MGAPKDASDLAKESQQLEAELQGKQAVVLDQVRGAAVNYWTQACSHTQRWSDGGRGSVLAGRCG